MKKILRTRESSEATVWLSASTTWIVFVSLMFSGGNLVETLTVSIVFLLSMSLIFLVIVPLCGSLIESITEWINKGEE